MATENKGLIDVRDCPCDGCPAKPCGHPARCVKFTLWLNKTVDAVPVVRCKDCKWYNRNEDIMPQSGSCEFHEMVKMDWDFCSRAKMDL